MRPCTGCSSSRSRLPMRPADNMSANRDQKRQGVWYGTRTPGLSLRLVAGLYGLLGAVRRGLYRAGWLRSVRLSVPVLVVGNISVGGTGKTPLIIALIETLREKGWNPGVVSRGYGGSQRGPALMQGNAEPAVYGDEPCLIRQRTDVPLSVGRDRPAAAQLLIQAGVDVILADDGLQHYRLGRDVEVCVIDGLRRFGNGRLLPAGPLREPAAHRLRVDFLVCNGGEPEPGETLMQLRGDVAQSLADPAKTHSLVAFVGQRVHAVAGIGHPQRFFDSLRAQGLDIVEHEFADHHVYQSGDLAFSDDLPVLMTEKDAVKCRPFARPDWWHVPVTAVLPNEFYAAVNQCLRRPQGCRGRL